jgi:hypothetical protein
VARGRDGSEANMAIQCSNRPKASQQDTGSWWLNSGMKLTRIEAQQKLPRDQEFSGFMVPNCKTDLHLTSSSLQPLCRQPVSTLARKRSGTQRVPDDPLPDPAFAVWSKSCSNEVSRPQRLGEEELDLYLATPATL